MDYIISFSNRAKNYTDAVKEFPNAFEEEFLTAVDMLKLNPDDILLNIPCGGIYIENLIPNTVRYLKLEVTKPFADIDHVKICTFKDIPYENESITKILSLACLHHLSDDERKMFYCEAYRVLKPNGKLVIGDVILGSEQDKWLNEIVNKYNSVGHIGRFFTENDKALMIKCGFNVHCEIKTYSWNFYSNEDMIIFFKKLMNLDLLEDSNTLKDLLYTNLKIKNNKVEWKLIYFICEKL